MNKRENKSLKCRINKYKYFNEGIVMSDKSLDIGGKTINCDRNTE